MKTLRKFLYSTGRSFVLPTWKIPLSDIDFGAEEEAAALRVIRSRWLSMGAEAEAFEREFAESLGVKHAIAVSNGTAALHLSLLALKIGRGDIVIQPALNFVAAANMTVAVGAVPAFGDICSLREPTLSPECIAGKPAAVIVMHYGGFPCRMQEIASVCRERGIPLIEDASHGTGGRLGERMLGTWGDAGCFSFFSNKNMVTGEGGMVTTNRDDIAASVRSLRSHGMTSLTWDRHRGHAASYDVLAHGFNYRIDEIRAAIGREQLKKLAVNNEKRRRFTALYWERLEQLERWGWTVPFKGLDRIGSSSFSLNSASCHLMVIVAPDAGTRARAADLLLQEGIQTSLHYPFIPGFAGFRAARDYKKSTMAPYAEQFCSRVLTLPLYPGLEEVGVERVCDALNRVAPSLPLAP
jgi:dTDP-4-amino-4,6-dideoxygalactose transaminase